MKQIMQFLNYLYRHKITTGLILGGIGFVFGIIGNLQLNSNEYWQSVLNTISYIGLNPPSKINFFIVVSFILIAMVVSIGAITMIFRKYFDNLYAKTLLKDKNIILFGFGEINRTFFNDFINNKENKRDESIIVIDKEEKEFDEGWEKGHIYLHRDITNDNLNFDYEETTNIIVALGNDRLNVDFGIELVEILQNVKTETKLLIHCNDNDLNELFFSKLKEIKENKINVKLFSFYTEIVDDLFIRFHKKLAPMEYVKLDSDKKELKIAIVGNSKLSQEVIKRIFMTFIFPNDVKTKIILIDKKVDEFKKEIEFITNYTAEKFPHIILEEKELDYNLLEDCKFWNQEDLIDVIIAYEDENKNLELAMDLYKKVYVFDNNKFPHIYFAMFDELHLSEEINKNEALFNRFFVFGNKKEILTTNNILDDESFKIAKQIHNGYGDKYQKDILNLDEKKLNKKWFTSTKYSDKLSNIAQYLHLDFKLLSLGVYKEKSDKLPQELLENNRKILFLKLKDILPFNENEIIEFSKEVEKSYSGDYNKKIVDEFWQKFIKNEKFYKFINTEHKRWNSYHFVNGWKYNDTKNKDKKLHNCLVDLKDFNDRDRQMTILYDIYSYLYIPNYLASSGYEIKS